MHSRIALSIRSFPLLRVEKYRFLNDDYVRRMSRMSMIPMSMSRQQQQQQRCTFSSLVTWSVDADENGYKIGTITLNSPETFNALTVEMGKEFDTLVTKLQHDLTTTTTDDDNNNPNPNRNVSAIVLCGAGEKAFSAGGDIQWLKSLKDNSVHGNVDVMLNFYNSFLGMRQKLPVPIIAALTGPAMGAGACLALACDLRIAAAAAIDESDESEPSNSSSSSNNSNHNNDRDTTTTNTRPLSRTLSRTQPRPILGFPFTKLGIPSGMGAIHLLQNVGQLSQSQVSEILLCGKSLSGEEAYQLGLINKLVPPQDVKSEAKKLAFELASSHKYHPVAIRSMIRSIRSSMDEHKLTDHLYKDAHAQAMCYARNDWGEGLRSRTPKHSHDDSPIHFDDYHSK